MNPSHTNEETEASGAESILALALCLFWVRMGWAWEGRHLLTYMFVSFPVIFFDFPPQIQVSSFPHYGLVFSAFLHGRNFPEGHFLFQLC